MGNCDEHRGLHLSRERWDGRHTLELLARCGGFDDRTERVLRLFEEGRVAEAWRTAGFVLDAPEHLLKHYRPGLTILAERARYLAAITGSDVVMARLPSSYALLLDPLDDPDGPRARTVPAHDGPPDGVPVLPHAAQHYPPVLLSIAHGEAMSPQFQEGFYDAVSTYVRTRDPDTVARDLENAVTRDKMPPR